MEMTFYKVYYRSISIFPNDTAKVLKNLKLRSHQVHSVPEKRHRQEKSPHEASRALDGKSALICQDESFGLLYSNRRNQMSFVVQNLTFQNDE